MVCFNKDEHYLIIFKFFDFQASCLEQLEIENQEAAEKLRDLIRCGEQELARLQHALVDIAHGQLDARKIEVKLYYILL